MVPDDLPIDSLSSEQLDKLSAKLDSTDMCVPA